MVPSKVGAQHDGPKLNCSGDCSYVFPRELCFSLHPSFSPVTPNPSYPREYLVAPNPQLPRKDPLTIACLPSGYYRLASLVFLPQNAGPLATFQITSEGLQAVSGLVFGTCSGGRRGDISVHWPVCVAQYIGQGEFKATRRRFRVQFLSKS